MTDLRPHIKAHGTADLLPCPFCGGRADIQRRDVEPQGDPWYGRKMEIIVVCDGCGATAFDGDFHEGFASPEHAVEGWNRRVPNLLPVEPPAAGEPVLWQYRVENIGCWSEWTNATEAEAKERFGRSSRRCQIRALYTAPAGDELVALREALREVIDAAEGLAGVRNLVAGWSGEGKEDGPYARHRDELGATLPTTCGAVYALDDALQNARALLAKHGGGE